MVMHIAYITARKKVKVLLLFQITDVNKMNSFYYNFYGYPVHKVFFFYPEEFRQTWNSTWILTWSGNSWF